MTSSLQENSQIMTNDIVIVSCTHFCFVDKFRAKYLSILPDCLHYIEQLQFGVCSIVSCDIRQDNNTRSQESPVCKTVLSAREIKY